MKVKIVEVGYLRTNCYILEKDNKCLIIDPGYEADLIISNIKCDLIGVLITHHHSDHISALPNILKYKDVKVYDFNNLKEGKISIGPFNFEVIYTPGHTNDSMSYYFYEDDIMFTGDFLFHGDTGRTDLDGGSNSDMIRSIEKIKKYKDNIIIYPGHEESTTLGNEKKHNILF